MLFRRRFAGRRQTGYFTGVQEDEYFLPDVHTILLRFFEYKTRNLRTTITFCGLQNYLNILELAEGEQAFFLRYRGNTLFIWLCKFPPQILNADGRLTDG